MTSYYAIRGGRSNLDIDCGTLFVNAGNTFSSANWGIGAALELLHIMLIAVVILALLSIAEFSLLLSLIVLLIPIGMLVLLYHLNFILCSSWW